ncbi:hydroxyethylthiazole kinase [Subtercola vilae]|uniref:Hydroxyethylthiazole kinase n=1 Tax=Subtercola vilae TaxID=2056433 RepID=A0A4T2C017_9MICO|nr:hydroxyethylthiazole kinase [Subtercola vilae]TIH37445.1 hydroxyethylthiazole kinase [Subtercola vilae]
MTIRLAPETTAATTTHDIVERSIALLDRVRAQPPLVQCITNSVVVNFTANVLLAVGASAAMVDIPAEAGPFAAVASGLLINLGTPHAEQREAMLEAALSAVAHGTSWVLDPVAIGSLPVRTALAAELVAHRPTLVRGNPSEIIALAGGGAGGRGVDSTDTGDDALDAAQHLARTFGSVVAISGPIDIVTDGTRTLRLANGDALLTRVTGGGCALGAVMAAFLGAAADTASTDAASTDAAASAGSADAFDATVAAITAYTVAAEIAAERASGPGSFAAEFVDALAKLTGDQLRERFVLA